MAPPSASGKSGKSKATLRPNLSEAVINLAPIAIENRRKIMSSEPTLPPPSKEAKTGTDDTLFQGSRELWLARRLTDPEIYPPLQVGKENSAPPGVRHRTKAAVHRQLASEFNLEKEHAGFMVDEGKIKNKIAKMLQHFKLAHRFRHSLDTGSMDQRTWQAAVKEKYAHYFVLEPVWATLWSDNITSHSDSFSNLGENVTVDGPCPINTVQYHSDGGSEDERNDVDTGSGLDRGWKDVVTASEDNGAEDIVSVAEDESQDRSSQGRHHSVNKAVSGLESLGMIGLQPNRDEQPISCRKFKEQQQQPISNLLNILDALGRYEIDARKEQEIRQMELAQKTELAEIELRKAIRLAEIGAMRKREEVFLDQKRELLLEREKRVLAKEKELEELLESARKKPGVDTTQSMARSTPSQNTSRSPALARHSE
jgi:hypothetical protein